MNRLSLVLGYRSLVLCGLALGALVLGVPSLEATPIAAGRAVQELKTIKVRNYQAIAAAQETDQWCWAACTQMLLKSQKIELSQENIVKKAFGKVVNWPTGGSFDPIAKALNGTYELASGARVQISAAFNYGVPTDVPGMIRSISEGRPFVFAWNGHAYTTYGLVYFETPAGYQITEVLLIDPMFGFGARKYASFVVGRDSFLTINGTLELRVRPIASGKPGHEPAERSIDAEDCEYCGGHYVRDCPVCDGTEQLDCPKCEGEGWFDCTKCDGTGDYKDDTCPKCDGEGIHACSKCDGCGYIDCTNSDCDHGRVPCDH